MDYTSPQYQADKSKFSKMWSARICSYLFLVKTDGSNTFLKLFKIFRMTKGNGYEDHTHEFNKNWKVCCLKKRKTGHLSLPERFLKKIGYNYLAPACTRLLHTNGSNSLKTNLQVNSLAH